MSQLCRAAAFPCGISKLRQQRAVAEKHSAGIRPGEHATMALPLAAKLIATRLPA